KLRMMPTLLVPSSRRLGAKVLSVQLHLSTPLSLKLNLLLLPLLNFPTWTSNAKLSSLNLLRLLHLSSVKSTLLPTSLTTICLTTLAAKPTRTWTKTMPKLW
ncbi:hypothetical protein H0H93_006521, partial [Arthromyces matolae]